MVKVNSYAPAWLCRPSPGAKFLSSSSAQNPAEDLQTGRKPVSSGATRTIAKRGNEVFAVVDNEIRWSNLARLKDQWQQEIKQKKGSVSETEEQTDNTQISPYRV
jgi:nucleoporin NUP82